MNAKISILNPKQTGPRSDGPNSIYNYYAGFSVEFATSLIRSTHEANQKKMILDPWNGGGTTTTVARALGSSSIGFDLNPVMIVVARAKQLSYGTFKSLPSIATTILEIAKNLEPNQMSDALSVWFYPSSVTFLRNIERAIQIVLVDSDNYSDLRDTQNIDKLSDLACFFYVAFFHTVKNFVLKYIPSNPTWVKRPKSRHSRVRPSASNIETVFIDAVASMSQSVTGYGGLSNSKATVEIKTANSIMLPTSSASIDLVLTSPPYCTRIDYAIATSVELSCLGYDFDVNIPDLRKSLIGTTSVSKAITPSEELGAECLALLDSIYAHGSKACSTYYYKTHVQYFDSLYKSYRELARVLKPNGICAIVVQDSYFKNIHNNLPLITTEMMNALGMNLIEQKNFLAPSSMSHIHPHSYKYRMRVKPTECVLCFSK